MKYKQEVPRLTVKYVDADTEEVIFEVNNRNWMNVGEMLTSHYATEVFKTNKLIMPQNLMILVIGEYQLTN
jgi:hypothetical protein